MHWMHITCICVRAKQVRIKTESRSVEHINGEILLKIVIYYMIIVKLIIIF